jgi:ADP-ribose pyrophosphatase YjhB (NUDIX family)
VEDQTGFRLGYIEQLYTFGDRGRHATAPSSAPHMMSIGYLALTRDDADESQPMRPGPGRAGTSSSPGRIGALAARQCWTRCILPALHAWLRGRVAMNRQVDPSAGRTARGAGLW